MATIVNRGIQACNDCVQIIANGEITAYPDDGVEHAEKMLAHYGPQTPQLVNGNEEYGFCSTPCEVCGDPLAGDREEVTELSEWRTRSHSATQAE